MSLPKMTVYILTMALITYLIRMIPIVFFRKKIKSQFILSLLYYMPYAILSAMTFPAIMYCTNNIITAIVGTVVAIVASLSKGSLIIVAVLTCVAVLGTHYAMLLF